MNTVVSIFAEIPEDLYDSLRSYLDDHPHWDLDRVFTSALSLFLLHNKQLQSLDASKSYQVDARTYLEALYQQVDRA